MKVLYFDCFSGISGDMTVGALLDLGIDKELFLEELRKLNLGGCEVLIEKTTRQGIAGTDFNVIVNEEYDDLVKRMEQKGHLQTEMSLKHDQDHSHDVGHNNNNDGNHNHHHDHDHDHHHDHSQDNSHHHEHGRNLLDIEALIDASILKQSIKSISKKVFREIARAEAKVHNKSINEIHFHEVGAVDSIVDIVGTSICLDLLGVKEVYCSPLHDGQGFIECAHGIIPVPVPAVMEILANSQIPLVIEDVKTELITPTGAGIVKTLCRNFGSMPVMIIDKVGYGFGKRETGRLNALRVVLGTILSHDSLMEDMVLLETNIDDTTSEILGFTMEKLLEHGAADVYYTSIYMKKNRPAYMLSVLCKKQLEEKMADIILRETSTIGVRRSVVKRHVMDREVVKINTGFGDVRVKISTRGNVKKVTPEYEDCKDIALKTGMPLIAVYEQVNRHMAQSEQCVKNRYEGN
ncbi:MAG TPA: nickel pincer cofactor biosynthesis protein LarC [Pseudobacteroides sp.]|uniref:nickel pincer cofactor biosynthesis protein LarC n=1 Tax=Pseudobacteroides sp. TaxID=1968840 RepID=UPI002F956147